MDFDYQTRLHTDVTRRDRAIKDSRIYGRLKKRRIWNGSGIEH